MQGRDRDVVLVISLVVLGILLLGLLGGGMMGYGWGGWMGPGMMGGFGLGWGILMLIFWAAVVGGIVLLVLRLAGQNPATAPDGSRAEDRALEILRERYARGEITKEQFDQMRKDLE
jgi:putative membrane protein